MSLSRQQKMVISMYRRAAALAEQEWRQLLWQTAGVRSLTDKQAGAHLFAQIMPVLELRVEQALHTGALDELPRQIKDLTYWRKQANAPGQANARKLHRVNALYGQLAGIAGLSMDAAPRSQYLLAMAAQANKLDRPPSRIGDLSNPQIDRLLEALKSRLKQEVTKP